MARSVLVVEDEPTVRETLAEALVEDGLRVTTAADGPHALERFRADRPDLVILDLMLPGMSGIEVCRVLRAESSVPILMLTARDSELDKVLGLELGADDYVTKPFSHRELLARIRAHLRRMGQEVPEADAGPRALKVGPIDLNVGEHSVKLDGEPVSLTVTEFRLLHALMRDAGSVVPTRQLLKRVWGHDDMSGSDVVRVTVHRLRRKLHDDAGDPKLLHTVAGVGVMLKTAEAPEPATSE